MQIEGTLYWTKLDKPRPNYNKQRKIMDKDGKPDGWGDETSVVFGNLTKETKVMLKDAGLLDKVKNKLDDVEDQITFRLPTKKRDGTDNDPIKVTSAETGAAWDWKEDGLIGNGSKGVMKFNVWKNGNGKGTIYPVSLLLLEHIEYELPEGQEQAAYEDPDDWSDYVKPEAAAKAPAKKAAKPKPADEDEDDVPY